MKALNLFFNLLNLREQASLKPLQHLVVHQKILYYAEHLNQAYSHEVHQACLLAIATKTDYPL